MIVLMWCADTGGDGSADAHHSCLPSIGRVDGHHHSCSYHDSRVTPPEESSSCPHQMH